MSSDSDSEYECKDCDNTYRSKGSLKRHMDEKHNKPKPCNILSLVNSSKYSQFQQKQKY